MDTLYNRTDKLSFLLLKIMYVYAKVFGMALFAIRGGEKPHLKYSVQVKFLSIGCRITCLVLYTTYVATEFRRIANLKKSIPESSTVENYTLIMYVFQFICIIGFTVVLIAFHAVMHKQFVKVVNRAIDVFVRIAKLSAKRRFFSTHFYLIILLRVALTFQPVILNIAHFYNGLQSRKYLRVLQWCSELYLWLGILFVMDVCFVGYIALADMYKNITEYMIEFEQRLEKEDLQGVTKSRHRRTLRTLCEEIEECTLIYSEIHNIARDFQKLFQFNILLTLVINFVSIVIIVHLSIWLYLVKGEIVVYIIVVGGVKTFEVLLFVFAVDRALRISRIAKCLNWESLSSDVDMDKRWHRAVQQFLNVLRFHDLKIEICGFFELNNVLSLQFLSVIVAYLTVLIQFAFLGYFHEEDYIFESFAES